MSDAADADDGDGRRDTAARVRRGLDYALLGGLVLLGFVAAVQFYFAADRTINVWVTREFRPPFKMVFNLVILLVVGVGLSRQVRRLTATDAEEETTDATADGGTESPSPTPGASETAATPAATGTDDPDTDASADADRDQSSS
jgi:hypothetical protein